MKKTKKKAAPVEAKKECACGAGCKCGCGTMKTVVLAGTALALILSGVAYWKAGCTKKMNETIEAYIKANPTVIIDSVNDYYKAQEQERQKPTPKVAPAELVAEIVNDKANYSLGNPKGKFVIIEFFDHQCGWCKKTNAEMRKAVKSARIFVGFLLIHQSLVKLLKRLPVLYWPPVSKVNTNKCMKPLVKPKKDWTKLL